MSEPPGWQPPAEPTPGPATPGWGAAGAPGTPGTSPGWGAAPPPLRPGTPWGGPPPAPKPGVVPLRPLGIGEILDAAIGYIRRNPRATLGLAASVALFDGILSVLFLVVFPSDYPSLSDFSVSADGSSSGSSPILSLHDVAQSAFSGFLQLIVTGMLTFVMSQAVLGRSVGAREAWAKVKPIFWRLIGVALLTGVILIGVVAACIAPGVLLILGGATGAGIFLLVIGVPGAAVLCVWIYVMLVLAPAALVLETTSVTGALRRSRDLVKTSWWRIFGITLLASIIAGVISGVISIPFAVIAGVGALLFDLSGDASFTAALFGLAIGGAVGTIVTLPFAAGVTSLLYIDRRMRREGLDLVLARTAGVVPQQQPPTAPGTQQW